VQQVDRRSVLLRVDGVESILPEREALHRDRFRQGDHVTAMLLDVDRMAKGPQIILTRSHPDFLRRLFENEVPEIAERIVEVRSIAREAGSRSKVAVLSHDDRVDAVGACVGVKGSRVQNIVRELGGERIDIVPWSQDPALFVTRALSPAKVQRVDVDEEKGGVTVVVAEDQLSLAIGKGGQNVRLAMKLSGWSIELVSEEQLAAQRELEEVADFDIEEIAKGIGPKLTERLIQAGLETARDVMNATPETLQDIEGVGPKSAEKVLAAVHEAYKERLEASRIEREQREAEEAAARAEAEAAEAAEAEAAEAAEAEAAEAGETDAEADGADTADIEVSDDEVDDTADGTSSEAREALAAEEPGDDGDDATPRATHDEASGADETDETDEAVRDAAEGHESEPGAETEAPSDDEATRARLQDGDEAAVTAGSADEDAADDDESRT
jgi:N utilization substance protein A